MTMTFNGTQNPQKKCIDADKQNYFPSVSDTFLMYTKVRSQKPHPRPFVPSSSRPPALSRVTFKRLRCLKGDDDDDVRLLGGEWMD